MMTSMSDPVLATAVPEARRTPAQALPRSSGTVVPYTEGIAGFRCDHERATRREVVRRLARLKGFVAAEEPRGDAWGAGPSGPVYYVPSDTLVGVERAIALGIRSREDLFGGVVPYAFVATKAITHPLVARDAAAPLGWSHDFHAAVTEAVLPGYSAFSREDAMRAGRELLARGHVRVKLVRETGGRGQTVVRDLESLQACLDGVSDEALAADGVVLERNLADVQTLSVGQVNVAGMVASYCGTQHLTLSSKGHEVYGGSDLLVARGDFHDLLALGLTDAQRVAVQQALAYDAAAHACFPGFFASRINYDIAQGLNAEGEWRSGVLEQSWRAGGATPAEIAALEAFQADPDRKVVRACCSEVHGTNAQLPAGATIYFQGVDDQIGPLAKFAYLCGD